jgi:hypothetical protein
VSRRSRGGGAAERGSLEGPVTRGSHEGYSETLAVPVRWWVLAAVFLASLLVAFAVALPLLVAIAAVAVLTALTGGLFLGYGGARISVRDGVLRAGRATIPVSLLKRPDVLGPHETRRVAGVDADARAYLLLRPYLRQSVLVPLDDPADPTPYWLLSTRRPERLVAALVAARHGSAPHPGQEGWQDDSDAPTDRRAHGFGLEDLDRLRTGGDDDRDGSGA